MQVFQKNRKNLLRHLAPGKDLWVFGYGSLIWNPAFNFAEKRPAKIYGFHRSFCLHLTIGRGSPEAPGLMLALDRGGSCNGMTFRIPAKEVDELRFMVIGIIEQKHWSAIITYRDEKVRIISVRRSRDEEIEIYES